MRLVFKSPAIIPIMISTHPLMLKARSLTAAKRAPDIIIDTETPTDSDTLLSRM